MARKGKHSGIPCTVEGCKGRMWTRKRWPNESDPQIIHRMVRCDVCRARQTRTDRNSGPPRLPKPCTDIDRPFVEPEQEKREDLPGQLTLWDLLSTD